MCDAGGRKNLLKFFDSIIIGEWVLDSPVAYMQKMQLSAVHLQGKLYPELQCPLRHQTEL